MSGFIVACGPRAGELSADGVLRLLLETSRRGRECRDVQPYPNAVLAAVRDRWELPDEIGGRTIVAQHDHVAAVTDASLYFRDKLADRIRAEGVDAVGDAPSDLVAAGYLAFGSEVATVLEGDFAFAVWDERTRRLVCARDPFGPRSLYFRELSGLTVVASTVEPLVQWAPGAPDFDPEGILRSLTLWSGRGTRTGYESIREVPAGHVLTVENGRTNLRRFWYAGGSPDWARLSSSDAPPALHDLLARTAAERLVPDQTAIAMSGGYDSTAVAAALRSPGSPVSDHPPTILSFRYPQDDPGNEDTFVQMAAEALDLPVSWVQTRDIPLFGDAHQRALGRSDPVGHPHEGQNRALARAARTLGRRILLNGHGGDNVFWADDVFAADLFRDGRFLHLREVLRARGHRGWTGFLNTALRPALPMGLFDALERVRGRPINSRPYERPIPSWQLEDPDLLAGIRAEDREWYGKELISEYDTVSDRQRAFSLMFSGFAKITASLFDLVRDEGVELRMPLFDQRVVAFSMARPPEELNRPGEIKALLRESMRGHLPDALLAPRGQRRQKTGTAEGYVRQRFRLEAPALMGALDARKSPWITEELGLISHKRFGHHFTRNQDGHSRWEIQILTTLLAEQWLESRAGAIQGIAHGFGT